MVLSADDKNGKIVGNYGIWSDDGSSDGLDSESDDSSNQENAENNLGMVESRCKIGIVSNKMTHPVGVPTLSSDESEETKITEIAMTYTSKVNINHLYINHA
ncbi:hypothetical protein Tco_0034174 [Tanacetum coccineum]